MSETRRVECDGCGTVVTIPDDGRCPECGWRLSPARLATPASAPVGETTDTERLDALEAGEWTIHCNFLGPDHPDNWVVTEDHFDGDDRRSCGATLRQAIDAARAAERRDQEEGR